MDRVAEIKQIYQRTSRATIARDIERAIDLLKSLDTEEERERAAVYMDGLSQMRSEWKAGASAAAPSPTRRRSGKQKLA
jgi:hypothetical protein